MNLGFGGGADFGGLQPIADLAQDVTDMQLTAGATGGLGIQNTGGGVSQGLSFGNAGDLAGLD
jgi:hypothetical protein